MFLGLLPLSLSSLSCPCDNLASFQSSLPQLRIMLEQVFYFLFCKEYSTLGQPNLYHVSSPPNKTDSTSIPSAGGNFGKYKTREYCPGRGTRYQDSLSLNSVGRSQLIAGSYAMHLLVVIQPMTLSSGRGG